MSEKQETVHVVMRLDPRTGSLKAAKVFDDRKDARAYVVRMNNRSSRYTYYTEPCKKG